MAEQRKPDSRGLNFFDVTDFSPGIYDNSLIAFGSTPTTVPGIFPAPPGAADASHTFGCMSLPNGGLGPLPALGGAPGATGLSLTAMGITGLTNVDITALINSQITSSDELVIGVNTVSGGFQTTHFYSYVVGGGGSLNSIQTQTYTYTGDHNFCTYPYSETLTNQPVVVLPLAAPDGPNSNLMVYPSVSAPTVFGVDVIATNASAKGIAFGHQGRIGIIQTLVISWPVTATQPGVAFGFNYTDPAQSETWTPQFEVFGPETPFGYGAVNSISAGELFCVKARGGAIIIQGDLNNPTVTTLGGVQSTGAIFGRSDSDANGMLYYCSQRHGAWGWAGGNASEKISQQLDENFFLCANPIASPFYSYYFQRWGNWMMCSNNWMRDSNTGGWWRLEDPSVRSYFWYVPGYDNRWMFAALPTAASSSTDFLFEYDNATPRNTFSWQSLPIKLPAEDRTATTRELVIRASNPYADVAPIVAASLIDDKGTVTALDTWTMTTGTDTVQEIRLNAGTKQTNTIAVRLTPSGTLYAPVIHGLSLGYRTREHAALG